MNSINQPPKKTFVNVHNPFWISLKVNSANQYTNVLVTYTVHAYNSSQGATGAYETKQKVFTANYLGTPSVLELSDINIPEKGPFLITGTIETLDCVANVSDCPDWTKGGKMKYSISYSFIKDSSSPSSILIEPKYLKRVNSICC